RFESRRQFLAGSVSAVGWAALASLMDAEGAASPSMTGARSAPEPAIPLHHTPKAKHVIYLHMVGGPPQMDLFDYKPKMNEWYNKELPGTVRMGQRLTTMTSGQ